MLKHFSHWGNANQRFHLIPVGIAIKKTNKQTNKHIKKQVLARVEIEISVVTEEITMEVPQKSKRTTRCSSCTIPWYIFEVIKVSK
jgi:hypothetical protein